MTTHHVRWLAAPALAVKTGRPARRVGRCKRERFSQWPSGVLERWLAPKPVDGTLASHVQVSPYAWPHPAHDTVLRHGIESAQEHFLQHPLTPTALVDKVRRVLERARQGRARPSD